MDTVLHDMRYAIPNVQVDYTAPATGTPVSYWRSVGYSQNTYFMEAFLDEMAAAAGKDPVEFRRSLLAGNVAGPVDFSPTGRFRGI